MPLPLYSDRQHAGRVLAGMLSQYIGQTDVVVWGLPRGGIPVAFEVARALHTPLDACIVRKLGVPGHQELAMGAIGPGGTLVLHADLIGRLGLTPGEIQAETSAELEELERREQVYRAGRPPLATGARTIILVDDGVATGATMQAAAQTVRRLSASARIVVAVPVASPQSCHELRSCADEVVCAATPSPFVAVGRWYEDFTQTSDAQVMELLSRHPASA